MSDKASSVRQQQSEINAVHPLIELPAELRNIIWGLLIPSNDTPDTSGQRKTSAKPHPSILRLSSFRHRSREHEYRKLRQPNPPVPAIVQVCQALRPETARIFYGSNVFQLRDGGAKDKLELCPQIGVDAMRKVVISYFEDHSHEEFLQVHLNLKDGVIELITWTDCWKNQFTNWGNGFASRHLFHREGWSFEPYWSYRSRQCDRVRVFLPTNLLHEKIDEARQKFGLANGKEMTCQRLRKIVNALRRDRATAGSDKMSDWVRKVLTAQTDGHHG